MTNKQEKATPENGSQVKEIREWILLILTAIPVIPIVYGFISAWRGSREYLVYVIIIAFTVVLVASLGWIGFSYRVDKDKNRRARKKKTLHAHIPRYSRKYRIIARCGLGVALICGFVFGIFLYQHVKSLDEKTIILVTNLDEGNTKDFRVTDTLISKLNQSLADYDDFVIQPVTQSITEVEGSAEAQRLGAEYRADIVLWGWYGLPDQEGLFTLHIENLNPGELGVVKGSGCDQKKISITDMQSFDFQTKISSDVEALALFLNGYALYKSGNYDAALDRFTHALSQPGLSNNFVIFSNVYLLRGNIYFLADLSGKALDEYNLAIENNIKFAGAYLNRGSVYYRLGQYDDSFRDFNTAIQYKEDLAEAYYGIGYIYNDRGNYQLAVENLAKAITFAPKLYGAHHELGVANRALGKTRQAINNYNQAIWIKRDNAVSYYNRGNAYEELGMHQQAITDFNQAIKLAPQNPCYFNNRGVTYISMGSYQEAIRDFSQAIDLKPDFASAYLNRASVYTNLDNHTQAITDFNRSIEINPNIAEAYYGRGNNYTELGQNDKAIEDLSYSIQLRPDFALAYYYRALAYKRISENVKAKADFCSVLKISNDAGLRDKANEGCNQ